MGALAAAAGGAEPPVGGPEPVNPGAAGLCGSLPHPTPGVRSAVTAACLSTCTTTGTSGTANADVRKLGLQFPRRYAKAMLSCRAKGGVSVAWKLVSRTLVDAAGVHVAGVRLPQSFDTVRISCTSRTKLVCVVKRMS